MESAYGPGLDPTPYFLGAYGLATLAIVGFLVWTIVERRKLRALLAAIKDVKK